MIRKENNFFVCEFGIKFNIIQKVLTNFHYVLIKAENSLRNAATGVAIFTPIRVEIIIVNVENKLKEDNEISYEY